MRIIYIFSTLYTNLEAFWQSLNVQVKLKHSAISRVVLIHLRTKITRFTSALANETLNNAALLLQIPSLIQKKITR